MVAFIQQMNPYACRMPMVGRRDRRLHRLYHRKRLEWECIVLAFTNLIFVSGSHRKSISLGRFQIHSKSRKCEGKHEDIAVQLVSFSPLRCCVHTDPSVKGASSQGSTHTVSIDRAVIQGYQVNFGRCCGTNAQMTSINPSIVTNLSTHRTRQPPFTSSNPRTAQGTPLVLTEAASYPDSRVTRPPQP